MALVDRRGEAPAVNRDDLLLMMESYKNQIELNTTLLTRQEVIITKQEEAIGKQQETIAKLAEIATLQGETLAVVGAIPNVLKDSIRELCENTSDTCKNLSINVDKALSSSRQAQINEHNGITNRIYLGWVGMGTIVIALVGIIIKIM